MHDNPGVELLKGPTPGEAGSREFVSPAAQRVVGVVDNGTKSAIII